MLWIDLNIQFNIHNKFLNNIKYQINSYLLTHLYEFFIQMFSVDQIDITVKFMEKLTTIQKIKMIKNWNFDLIFYRISNSRPSTLATTFTVRTGGLMSKLYKTNLFGILKFD